MRTLEISIAQQKLRILKGGIAECEYPISSAANGIGFDEGSYCTPTGEFEIIEKFGEGEPSGTIFKARKPIGIWDGCESEHDHVLTRILRLHGINAENSNTYDRYIYIHGTNQESLIGQPVSCGCIRMRNNDIIDLYDRIDLGASVIILK